MGFRQDCLMITHVVFMLPAPISIEVETIESKIVLSIPSQTILKFDGIGSECYSLCLCVYKQVNRRNRNLSTCSVGRHRIRHEMFAMQVCSMPWVSDSRKLTVLSLCPGSFSMLCLSFCSHRLLVCSDICKK